MTNDPRWKLVGRFYFKIRQIERIIFKFIGLLKIEY
jgi:hypothetical protein